MSDDRRDAEPVPEAAPAQEPTAVSTDALEEPSPVLYDQPPQTIIVGILGIDRDVAHVDAVYAGIAAGLSGRCRWSLLVIAREQDRTIRERWRAKGATVVTVANYVIEGRHNWPMIAVERNQVCALAAAVGVEALFFLDGDVVVGPAAVADALECSRYADVTTIPYVPGQERVGRVTPAGVRLVDVRELTARERYPRIAGGAIGCSLIRRRALDVLFFPAMIDTLDGVQVHSEDVGFFLTIKETRPELVVRAVSWPHHARHLVDGATR